MAKFVSSIHPRTRIGTYTFHHDITAMISNFMTVQLYVGRREGEVKLKVMACQAFLH